MGAKLEVCDGETARDWHDPVCYSESSCPCCALIKIIAEKDAEIERLKNELASPPDA